MTKWELRRRELLRVAAPNELGIVNKQGRQIARVFAYVASAQSSFFELGSPRLARGLQGTRRHEHSEQRREYHDTNLAGELPC